jgi:hypothetical protein
LSVRLFPLKIEMSLCWKMECKVRAMKSEVVLMKRVNNIEVLAK